MSTEGPTGLLHTRTHAGNSGPGSTVCSQLAPSLNVYLTMVEAHAAHALRAKEAELTIC